MRKGQAIVQAVSFPSDLIALENTWESAMKNEISGGLIDLGDIDLSDIESFDIEIFNVNDSAAVPEGGASTASCGGGNCSCSTEPRLSCSCSISG